MNDIPLETIASAMDGNEDAFAEIVEVCQSPVYNLCYRMLFDEMEAEEAAQETFWKAWTKIGSFDINRSFATWILSIAAHYCIDLQRKKKLPTTEIDETMEEIIPENSPLPERLVIQGEDEKQLQKILKMLNETDRAAIILRYWYDFSDKEIAERLSISESAVKSRLFRARKQLAGSWENEK